MNSEVTEKDMMGSNHPGKGRRELKPKRGHAGKGCKLCRPTHPHTDTKGERERDTRQTDGRQWTARREIRTWSDGEKE